MINAWGLLSPGMFATGECNSRDFLRLGLVVGLITPALVVLWTSLILDRLLGLA